MAVADIVKPINANHSIKEAVIGLFLASPIIKAEKFRDLIESDFKTTFQQFEPLVQFQFQFKPNNTTFPIRVPPPNVLDNIGFKFTGFDKGVPTRILQGQNDNINSRTFISYHTLNYDRWKPFLEDYLKIVASISKFRQELFITAISLHYVDQFLWTGSENIELGSIFNKNANSIPKDFFSSKLNNYSTLTEKQIDGNTKYLDRLEITVDSVIKPSITISHNVTQPLTDIIDLPNLINKDAVLETILNRAHQHNKSFLKDLLSENVCEMINLK